MAATGWDYHTLQSTPHEIVERMALYLEAQSAYLKRNQGGDKDGPPTLGQKQ